MGKILWILFGVALLLAPSNICLGDTPAATICMCSSDRGESSGKSHEEETEEKFRSFIFNDVIGGKSVTRVGNTLYYAGFSDVNDAFGKILNFISPAAAMIEFDRTKAYKTDLITVVWKENAEGETAVREGFAQIEVTFTKRDNAKYTVVFQKK